MIDIIIPLYKAKNTIMTLLYSLMYQDFDDFTLYLINDHDGENYDEEINFFKNFFKIEYVYLSKNHGCEYCRNKGISISNSKYIMFMDGDDCLYNNHSISMLYNEMVEKNLDMVVSYYDLESASGLSDKQTTDSAMLHGKLFRRGFLEENGFEYQKKTRVSGDCSFNQFMHLFEAKTSYIDKPSYIWRWNYDSLSRKRPEGYNMIEDISFIYNLLWVADFAERKGHCAKNLIKYILTWFYYKQLENKYDYEDPFLKESMKWARKYYKKYNDSEFFKEDLINQFFNLPEDKQINIMEPILDSLINE